MADLCCSCSFMLPLFLPPKQYFSCALHSHNSRFSTIQKRSPLLLKPSPFAASASDTVLISTHEHSDGSIIFRFGDPSEVEKNVEMEESIIIKEEREGEDTYESSMVQVKEGEDETEGTASVLTEASDCGDSIVTISNTLIAVEGESVISGKSLATTVDIELPIVASDKEIRGISSPDLAIEQIENLEGLDEGYTDSSPVEASIPDESSQMENTTVEVSNEESLEETSNVTFTSEELEISSIPGVEVEQQDVNVEECLNKEDVYSPADASILEQSSEVVDNVSTVALLEKESDDIGSSDIDAEQTERAEAGIDGDYEDGSTDVESGIPALVLLENETNGDTSTSAIEIEPTGHVEERINEEEYEDSPPVDTSVLDKRAEVLNNTKAALSEIEAAEFTSAHEDSPVDASVLDKISQVEKEISAVDLWENETDGDTSTSNIEIEPTGNVEERINEEYEDSLVDTSVLDKSAEVLNNTKTALSEIEAADVSSAHEDSPVDASVLDKSSEVENGISAVVLLEKETDGDTSTSDIEIEPTGNVGERINEEYGDSFPVDTSVLDKRDEVLNNTKAALSENEAADITSAHYGDSPVDASVPDKSSKVVYGTSAVVLLKKETDGNTSICDIEIEPTGNVEEDKNKEYDDSPVDMRSEVKEPADVAYAPDIDIEYTGNVEQGLDEVHEKPSSVDANDRPEVEICITAQEFSEKETADTTTAVALNDPVVSALDADADQGGLETVVTTNGVPTSELLTAETAIHDEKTGDDRESFGDDLVSSSSDSETVMSLYEETEVPNLQAEVQNLATEESTETDMDNNKVVEMQNETEDESPSMEPAMAWSIGSEEQASGSGSGVSSETVGYESEKDIIQLLTVSPQLEADSILEEETGEADSMLEEKSGEANSVLEKETGEADKMLEEETGEADSMLEEKTGEANSVLKKETGKANSVLKEETGEADSMLEEKSGEANSVLKKETGEANSIVEEDTGEADSMLEEEIGEADSMVEEKTGEANSVLEKETGEANSVLKEETGEANSVLEEETGKANSVLEEETVEADSVLEEDTGTETVEEPRKYDGSENQTVGGDLAEASVEEVTAPESIESTITSQEILMTDFVLSSGAALLPHPSKVLTGGEDAYFIADQTWLGVADGVSQWSLEGTIPGGYAQELMENCENLISDCSGNSINNPIELLNRSVAQTHSSGSSTVLIAQFDGQALHVANVGDSGFIILRHGAVYKRSSPMHHVFSLPVRIGRGDDPSSLAQLYRVDLEEEDIIVTATDGLFDNLYDQEILLIAIKSLADDKTPKEIAELLAKKAQEVGSSASARSPFADEAQAAGFPAYSGGMLDDVAVIVSVVRRR